MNSASNSPAIPLAARAARWIASLHVIALLVHMGAAIAFVSGVGTAYLTHAKLAWLVFGLGILQALAVLNPALPRIERFYLLFAVIVVIGEVLQLFVIPRGHLAYHVTVAMLIWGCSLAIYVRVLNPEWAVTPAAETA